MHNYCIITLYKENCEEKVSQTTPSIPQHDLKAVFSVLLRVVAVLCFCMEVYTVQVTDQADGHFCTWSNILYLKLYEVLHKQCIMGDCFVHVLYSHSFQFFQIECK